VVVGKIESFDLESTTLAVQEMYSGLLAAAGDLVVGVSARRTVWFVLWLLDVIQVARGTGRVLRWAVLVEELSWEPP
jgi:hypothetical protein